MSEKEDTKKKRLYWLSLKKDFFKRHDVRIIKSMDNGKDYLIFYLELLCESLDHEGKLRFSEAIPYNENMLATITDTNIDIVRSAIKLFMQLGLVELWDDGTYYMTRVQEMSGSYVDNDNARRQREFYERQKLKALEERYEGVRKPNDNIETINKNNNNNYNDNQNNSISDSFIDGHTNLEHGENDDSYHDSSEVDTKTAAYNGVKAHDVALEWQKRFAGIDGLSATGKITVQKETAIGTILQHYSVEEINQTFDKLAKSEFLRGGNPSGWKATFDWFIKLDNFDKVFSGNYDNRETNTEKVSVKDMEAERRKREEEEEINRQNAKILARIAERERREANGNN